jgi:hypothetical protein
VELCPPLDDEAIGLALGRVVPVARVDVVIARARGRIERERRLGRVGLAAHRGDRVPHAVGQARGHRLVIGRDVFGVGIARLAALAVPGRVAEVLGGVVRLVLIVTPVVEDQLRVAVHVDKPARARHRIDEPAHVGGLGFGERCRAVESLRARAR